MSEKARDATGDDWTLSSNQMAALLEAVAAVGREVRLDAVLRRIVECATELVGARYGALGILDAERIGLADFLYVGLDRDEADTIGALPEGTGLLGELIHDPRPLRLDDLNADPRAGGFPPNHPPMRRFLGVPVRVRGEVFGNLYLTDKTDTADVTGFSAGDEHLAVALAAMAGVAVENSRLHTRVSQLAVVEDRERIARELHDTVIQRIFSIGLTLEGIGAQIDDPEVASRLTRAASDLDDTVQQVRTAVFNLDDPRGDFRPVRSELSDFVDEVSERVGILTSIRFDGDIDATIGLDGLSHVTERLFATIRDAVVGLRDHHAAEHADLAVSVGRELALRIETGPLPDDPAHDAWLARLRDSAASLGGRMDLVTGSAGSAIVWTVPLDPR